MDFEKKLKKARMSDKAAMLKILEMYRPLLVKSSIVNGKVDEDLYQELVYTVLMCIKKFRYDK